MIRSTTVVGTLDISVVFVVTVTVIDVDSSKYMHKIHVHKLTSTPTVTPPINVSICRHIDNASWTPVAGLFFGFDENFTFFPENCVCKRYHPFYSIHNFASTWLPLTLACAFAVIFMFEKHFVCICIRIGGNLLYGIMGSERMWRDFSSSWIWWLLCIVVSLHFAVHCEKPSQWI